MKVNRSLDVSQKLPLKVSVAAAVIDFFAPLRFAGAVIILVAAACDAGTGQKLLIQRPARQSPVGIPVMIETVRTPTLEGEASSTENTNLSLSTEKAVA